MGEKRKVSTDRFEDEMIRGVNHACDMSKAEDKLKVAMITIARLRYQLCAEKAKAAASRAKAEAKQKKRRKVRFFAAYTACLIGAISSLLFSAGIIPAVPGIVLLNICVTVCAVCLALEVDSRCK